MPEHTDLVREDSLNVFDGGRITIPARIRNNYDLFHRRLVHVVVLIDGDEEHFNAPLDSGNRVTIPNHIRKEHNIDDGDQVDVKIGVNDG